MNIAVIIAGGSGKRMCQDIPKQFLSVYDKPIIVYTLEAFQKHPSIDGILVACLEGWEDILKAYTKQFNIDKLKWIIKGGETGFLSAYNCAKALKDICQPDDIIIQHDSIRPLVSADIITDCIIKAKEHGSGLAAMRCQETIIRSKNGLYGKENIDRSEIMRVQTPQAYKFEKFLYAYEEAGKRGIKDSVYTNVLLAELGEILYFSLGSDRNFKITIAEDIEMFRSMLPSNSREWGLK